MREVCVLVLVLASVCGAQSTRRLEGEIISESGADVSHLTVELHGVNPGEPPVTARTGIHGEFLLEVAGSGTYLLRVLDMAGNQVTWQQVTVSPMNGQLEVRLPETPRNRPSGGTVTVTQLRHRPDKRAYRDALKAERLSKGGDHAQAAAALEGAVALDPEYAEAHGNLGAEYTWLQRYADAVAEFRRSIALDPAVPAMQSNLAFALIHIGKWDEAEYWARRSLQLDSGNAAGHYVLGCLLAQTPEKRAEAVSELKLAARGLPAAGQTLADLYRLMGKAAE